MTISGTVATSLLMPVRAWLMRLARVAMISSILMSASELLFWTAARPFASVPELVLTWAAYCFATYAFMIVLQLGPVVERYGLFLAGAIYGWLLEGCIVSTMFDAFPLQLAWTGLAWHASFSVLVCLWYLRRAAATWTWIRYLAFLSGIGAAYGFWSVFWILEGVARPDPAVFLGRSCLIIAPMLLGHVLLGRLPGPWRPSKLEIVIVPGGFGLLFLLKLASVANPVMMSFPVLIAVTALAITRLGRRHAGQEKVLARLDQPLPVPRFLALLLVPLVGTVVYSSFWVHEAAIATNIAVLIVSVAAGVWLYARALLAGLTFATRN